MPQNLSILSQFADIADRVVVLDTETTGVADTDRVIEVALITLDLSGAVIDEWDTLVNPQHDVGPTWLHGITHEMLTDAPTFGQILQPLSERLNGAIACAHNLPFDARMLKNEFLRQGVTVDFTGGLDTLQMTRAKLAVACATFGINIAHAHRALDDARATASLLLNLDNQLPSQVSVTSVGPIATHLSQSRKRR